MSLETQEAHNPSTSSVLRVSIPLLLRILAAFFLVFFILCLIRAPVSLCLDDALVVMVTSARNSTAS